MMKRKTMVFVCAAMVALAAQAGANNVANIDHRRVPNLQCYFKRKGWSLKATKKASDYEPGDFVTVIVGGRLPHIMIVSDKKAADGTPLVIHNIGSGTKEENCLFTYPLTGHYRMKAVAR